MNERLKRLYEAMKTLQEENLPIDNKLLAEVNVLEEEIIKNDILPIVTESIEPALKQVRRELVLVVDYVPGESISVHLSRKRKFIENIKDAVAIVSDPEVVHKVVGKKRKRSVKASITRLKITYADGRVIYEPKASATLVKFVEEVGVERVRSLGLIQSKVPLVSNTLDQKYKQAQKPLGGGWYLITHSSTSAKIRTIKKIAKAFGIKLKVEAVPNFHPEDNIEII